MNKHISHIEPDDLEDVIIVIEEAKERLWFEVNVAKGARAYCGKQYVDKKNEYNRQCKLYDYIVNMKKQLEDND